MTLHALFKLQVYLIIASTTVWAVFRIYTSYL